MIGALPFHLNCLSENEDIHTFVRVHDVIGLDVCFNRSEIVNEEQGDFCDDEYVETCLPEEAEFATVYGRTRDGDAMAVHDANLTSAGADEVAQVCRAIFAAILAASGRWPGH